MVKRAIARVNEVGFDTAKVEFMDRNGKFFDRDMYIVVFNHGDAAPAARKLRAEIRPG